MDDHQVHHMIEELVNTEQELRASAADLANLPERAVKLKTIEVQLDQCWDLLRQREAKIRAGESPDSAQVRPPGDVEGDNQ